MTDVFLQFAEAKKRPHIVLSPTYTPAHKHDSMPLCTFAPTASSGRRQAADTTGRTGPSIYDAPHRPDDAITNIIALEMGIPLSWQRWVGVWINFRATLCRFGQRHQVVSACISASSARISSIAMRSRRTKSCSSCRVAVALAATSKNFGYAFGIGVLERTA